MNAILLFTVATIFNVCLSTIRSLCTIKGGKMVSAITNALCYGFYPLIVMLTAKDTVSIVTNMAITAIANFVCVYVIKLVEEKARKDKLWKVEMAIPLGKSSEVIDFLKVNENKIPFNYNYLGKWCIFNCYCETQEHSAIMKEIALHYGGKISAYESKSLI